MTAITCDHPIPKNFSVHSEVLRAILPWPLIWAGSKDFFSAERRIQHEVPPSLRGGCGFAFVFAVGFPITLRSRRSRAITRFFLYPVT
jgi:hypothetical protein